MVTVPKTFETTCRCWVLRPVVKGELGGFERTPPVSHHEFRFAYLRGSASRVNHLPLARMHKIEQCTHAE